MSRQRGSSSVRCERCGHAADGGVNHSRDDPLQVFECRRCGSILDIGGHRW